MLKHLLLRMNWSSMLDYLEQFAHNLPLDEQADSSANRQYEGVGGGLPLAKRLIRKQDGELRLESKAGVGTTGTVGLPRERVLRGCHPDRPSLG